MPRAGINKEINTFVKGLITEANLLAFPPDASIVDENWLLNLDGSRQRRFGLNFENGGKLTATPYLADTIAPVAISLHEWDNASDDTGIELLVVQIGRNLYFYDKNAEAPSAVPKNQSNAMVINDIDPTFIIESANMDGNLVIVTGTKFINILSYDPDTDVVSQSARNIKVRDRWGVDDGLRVDTRPSTLSDEHRYNLINQGWKTEDRNAFFNEFRTYPSNVDVAFLGRDAENIFDPAELEKIDLGNTPAAKGHIILDAFDRGGSRGTGVSTGSGGSSSGGGFSTFPYSPVDLA